MERQEHIEEEREIDLRELFFVLFRKKVIILLVTVIFMLSAVLVTKLLISPVYYSSAQVYILNRQNQNSIITSSDLSSALQLTNDAKVVMTSRETLQKVIENLGLDMSVEQLAGMVSVSTDNDTRILKIGARSTDAFLARDIVNEVVEIGAENVVEKMGVERMSLLDSANLPTAPSSPSLKKNMVLAGGCGFAFSCVIILALYLFNDKIRIVEDVERYLNLTNLGIIPADEALTDDTKNKKKNRKRSKR